MLRKTRYIPSYSVFRVGNTHSFSVHLASSRKCAATHTLLFPLPRELPVSKILLQDVGEGERGEEVKFDYREVNTQGLPLSVSFSLAVSLAGASSSLSSSWADVPRRIPRRTTSTYPSKINECKKKFVCVITLVSVILIFSFFGEGRKNKEHIYGLRAKRVYRFSGSSVTSLGSVPT